MTNLHSGNARLVRMTSRVLQQLEAADQIAGVVWSGMVVRPSCR